MNFNSQFSINSMTNDEIEKKINQLKKHKKQLESICQFHDLGHETNTIS